jgi:MFS family permease
MAQALLDKQTDWPPAILNGLFSLSTAASAFFLPIFFQEQLGFTGSQIGFLYALHAIAGLIASVPAGLGNDRITSRFLVGMSLVLYSVLLFCMAKVQSFPLYAAVFFCWALANGVYRLSLDVQVLKSEGGAGVARRVILFQNLRFIGWGFGTLAAGYLLGVLDFRLSLTVVSGICLVLAIGAFRLKPTPVARIRLADYGADIAKPKVLAFAAWIFLFTSHWGAETTCYGLFLRRKFELGYSQMGLYMTVEFAAMVGALTWMLFDRKTEKRGLRFYAFWGLLGSGIGHVGMIFPPIWLSAVFRAIHGAGDGLMFMVLYVGIAKLFEIQRMGGNAGFINLAAMLGAVAGALASGAIGERLGYHVPLFASGVVVLALIIPVVVWGSRKSADVSVS